MSITGIINNNTIPEIAEFLKNSVPLKDDFKSYRYNKAFLTCRDVIAPYNLPSPSYASTVGTSFDYLARFEIAHQLNSKVGKSDSLNIVAKYGIEYLKYVGLVSHARFAEDKYNEHMENIIDYINGYDVPERWIYEACSFFSVLEHFVRSGKINKDNIFLELDSHISLDLSNMINAFKKEFIGKYVNSESIVVFNPTFRCFDGADADIFIDGTLYDFKTSKSLGYKNTEVAQIWAYFLLHEIDKHNIEIDTFSRLSIDRIGIYKARCADVDYVDLNKNKHNIEYNRDKFEKLLKCYKLYKGHNYRGGEIK